MRLIGHGRYRTEAYPVTASGPAEAALRNRNVSAGVISLTAPFTPDTGGAGSIVAAILFTPRVSGVVQVAMTFELVNGVDPETYALAAQMFTGTGLSVTGGEATSNDWVVGSTTPPIVGGTGAITSLVGVDIITMAGGGTGVLNTFGISQAQPLGVPFVVQGGIAQNGGGHAIAGINAFGLSILELP